MSNRAATALIAVAVGIGGLAVAAPAAAHTQIVATAPAEGAVLVELPAEFSVTASEDLFDATGAGEGFALQIIDAAGTHYETGVLTISGPTLSTPAVIGAAGAYRLAYQVVSEDGHPIAGEVAFTWAPPEPEPTAEPTATPTETPPAPEATAVATALPAESGGLPPGGQLALWIVGALAIAAALVVTVLALRRR